MFRWLPIRKFWKRSPSFLRAALATLPVLGVTFYLYFESRNSERLLLDAETERTADNASLQFREFAETRINALNDAGNFLLATSGESGRANFAPFVQRLLASIHDFESVSWIDPQGQVIQTVGSPLAKGPLTFAPGRGLLPNPGSGPPHPMLPPRPRASASPRRDRAG